VGSFWIKFTPLFPALQEALQLLMRNHPDLILENHLTIFENTGYMT